MDETVPVEEERPNRGKQSVERMQRLGQRALEQTEEAIAQRWELNERFLQEIEKEIAAAKRMLDLLGEPWQHGERTEWEFMRISLDKAIYGRRKERRERRLQVWRDMLELNEKRLQLIKEMRTFG